VDSYRTEEEQVEALRRWWDENGRSTIAAIVIALSAAYGWQTWQSWNETKANNASDLYQAMINQVATQEVTPAQRAQAAELAQRLSAEYGDITYAQFAALQLAQFAVHEDNLAEAEQQLRWALTAAGAGSDTAAVAQLRLARVLAAQGEQEQALAMLQADVASAYQASDAIARGDGLVSRGRHDEAREAYTTARAQALAGGGQINLATLEQKLQALSPIAVSSAAAEE
jgi:predicted negative regulator of RcsB-dependent stress response